MQSLPNVQYVAASSTKHFVKLLDRVLVRKRPVRAVHFGKSSLATQPDTAIFQKAPRFILGLDGNHTLLLDAGGGNCEMSLCSGDVVFFPALGWNLPCWRSRLEFLSVIFSVDHIRFLHGRWAGRGRPRNTYYHTPGVITGAGAHLVSVLGALANSPDDYAAVSAARATVEALLWELRRGLLAVAREKPRQAQQTWQAIANHLQENLHQPLSLGMVAERFQLHPNHISRLFRRVGQEGFIDHLTRIRMERADLLLAEGRSNIESVALACGFTDVGYFRRVFRRFYGSAPSRRAAK